MTDQGLDILDQALKLQPIERAELIEALFRSFDKDAAGGSNILWSKEAESRIDAYDAGKLFLP